MTAPLGARARLTRALAGALMRHAFPGCSVLLRNGYKLAGPAPRGPLQVPTLYGFAMQIDPRRHRGVDASIYFNGTYEAGCIDVIRRLLRPGDTFVDAGANIGLMSLAAAQRVGPGGRVYAFEPVPAVHRVLQANVALNGYAQVTTVACALGAARQQLTIFEQPAINFGSASFVKPQSAHVEHVVDVVALDDFVREHRVPRVHVIKADVEGWELELVRGGRALLAGAEAPALCLEYSAAYSPRSGELPELYEFVRSVNAYRVYKLRHGKETCSPLVPVRDLRDLPRHDNIFCLLPHHADALGLRA
jgi:FkbM family methyltransferase